VLAKKLDEWEDFIAPKRVEGGSDGSLLINRAGCAPSDYDCLKRGIFFDRGPGSTQVGVVNPARVLAAQRQADTFARAVLGEKAIDELNASWVRSTMSKVYGMEKGPPHVTRGRGCMVEVSEPSPEHKMRRCLALHAGLRRCATAGA